MPLFNLRHQQALIARQQQGLYRQLQCHDVNSKILNFASNDYLGLAQEPKIITAWQQGLAKYGAGSTASPLVTGFQPPHVDLEQQLTEWLGYQRALLFNSGFSANQAVLFTLLQAQDQLFQDKLNHASLIEAGMLSPAKMKRFAHNDIAALQRQLSKIKEGLDTASLVVTEGVFSMDGDCAPLTSLREITTQHQTWLMVDDAHGCGVLGDEGQGSCHQAGIKADILIITFGKAFGIQGAAVLCSQDTAEYLVQFARHYIYSTAMPPAQAAALSQACTLIQTQSWRREKLQALSESLNHYLDNSQGLIPTITPIKPMIIGDSCQTMAIAAQLQQRGIKVGAIRPPTVAPHSARLRITLTANHNESDIRQLALAMNEVIDAG
ncbi:8-amino-7-oxononanoate synthase [uncultured Photobacterium sp.]|uniref:8-amino-7-oxononanoate synthase n=1 Tax=uncultured Photobacterium sp. TaxID=173973 RepID=UPI002624B9A7|nr:8-amino-7-oxononanoate synthase [uncultured Photobacterium sp.]